MKQMIKLPGNIILTENMAKAYLSQLKFAYEDMRKKWELEFPKLKPEHKRYLKDMESKISLIKKQLKTN